MPGRWDERETWVRFTVVFALILLIATGLCGVNFAVYNGFHLGIMGPSSGSARDTASLILMGTAFAELLGMAVGALGLVLSLLALSVVAIVRRFRPHP